MIFKCVSVIVLAIMVVTSIMGESISNSGQGFDLDGNPSIKSSSADILEFEDMPAKPEKTTVDGNVYLGTASDDNEGLKKIDVIELSSVWLVLDLNFYKSSKSYKEFEEALDVAYKNAANANLELKSNAKKFLKDKVKEKQMEGDLEQVLIFRNALDTIDQGILGSDPQIVELKNNFAKHNLNIKKDYFRNVIVVASKFNNQLEQQKKELTVDGKIEKAKKIDIFQRKLKKWAQVLAREISTKNDNSSSSSFNANQTSNAKLSIQQKIVSIEASNPANYICSAQPGDIIEISYINGKWAASHSYIAESPNEKNFNRSEHKCRLVKKNDARFVLAEIPHNTNVNPFRYTVTDVDGTEFALRINDKLSGDSFRLFNDNIGTVQYSIRVIRKGGANNASNFFNIESNEDKRVLGKDKSPVIQSSSLQSKRNFSNFKLTGTQEETFITLKKSSNPYIIKEQYRVPSGSELIVEPGVTLIFEKGASLYCDGKVLMNGTKHDPIFLKGKIPANGYWKGLTVKNSNSNLEYIKITDAETGITINEGSPNISFSIFTHCKRGAVAEGSPTFFNCLFSNNEENGVWQHGGASRDGASFELCSFKDNLGWGFDSRYYAKATFTSCLFENNKGGGIKSILYQCKIKAKGCYFKNNHTFDVLNESENTWNFEENYWGSRVTRKLQQKGDGVNLENIKDGKDSGDANIVLIGKFLTKEPDKYGSTVDF